MGFCQSNVERRDTHGSTRFMVHKIAGRGLLLIGTWFDIPEQQGRQTYAVKYRDTTTLFYVTPLLSWRNELKGNRRKNQKQHSAERR